MLKLIVLLLVAVGILPAFAPAYDPAPIHYPTHLGCQMTMPQFGDVNVWDHNLTDFYLHWDPQTHYYYTYAISDDGWSADWSLRYCLDIKLRPYIESQGQTEECE